jgi:carboxymethylenebutenolidase
MHAANAVLVVCAAGIVGSAVPATGNLGQAPTVSTETIAIHSGALRLRAQVWRPVGRGPFPAVLFNHGSYAADDPLPSSYPETMGTTFARHGYVFLWLHREGTGLSNGRGDAEGDQMARAMRSGGVDARNRVQMQLLEHDSMDAAEAALAQLRARQDVDAARTAVVGHSFGGSLSLLLAARDTGVRGLVIFGGAAGSWSQSAALRASLITAVRRLSAPALFIHAANDYSTASGSALAAEVNGLGKLSALKIYPPFGPDPRAGHNFLFMSVGTWERDVFEFLKTALALPVVP